jgi:hypothetical protein
MVTTTNDSTAQGMVSRRSMVSPDDCKFSSAAGMTHVKSLSKSLLCSRHARRHREGLDVDAARLARAVHEAGEDAVGGAVGGGGGGATVEVWV